MNDAIHLTSPNDVAISTLGTSIGRRRSLKSQMKNTFFSPAAQRLIASNPNRLVQFSCGHLGSRGETALDTAHQTELTTLRKPLPTNQLNTAHFISRRTFLTCAIHFAQSLFFISLNVLRSPTNLVFRFELHFLRHAIEVQDRAAGHSQVTVWRDLQTGVAR